MQLSAIFFVIFIVLCIYIIVWATMEAFDDPYSRSYNYTNEPTPEEKERNEIEREQFIKYYESRNIPIPYLDDGTIASPKDFDNLYYHIRRD